MRSLLLSHAGRRVAITVGTIALASTAACSDEPTAPKRAAALPTAELAGVLTGTPLLIDPPPVVDGVLTPGEYVGGTKFSLPVKIPGNTVGSTAAVYVTHDQKYLYLAVVLDRKSPFHSNDFVAFNFDRDNDGITENWDDAMSMRISSTEASDSYRIDDGKNTRNDLSDGGTHDSHGVIGVVGNKGVFEFRKELNSGDKLHDFILNTSLGTVKLGMRPVIALEAGQEGTGTWVYSFGYMCELSIGKTFTGISCP